MVIALVALIARSNARSDQAGSTPPVLGLTEVYRHGGDALGDDPFRGNPAPNSAAVAVSSNPFGEGGSQTDRSFSGNEPSFYGGVPNEPVGGRDDTIAHFGADRVATEAAVDALRSDEQLRWRGGDTLTVDNFGTYLAELTPVVLRVDVRLTYHLLREGRAIPQQAVLESGTVVLVDVFGIPRIRAISATPLTLPQVVSGPQVSFTGDPWDDFDPSWVFAIRPSDEALAVLALFDLTTAGEFQRPCGTTGDRDIVDRVPTVPATTSTSTPDTPAPTTNPGGGEVDVSGIWILASEFSGVEGTLLREGTGFRYRTPQTNDHIGWDCFLSGQPGQTATMECLSTGNGYSSTWSATGPITAISPNGRPKLRFDGTSAGPATTMTLTPQ
ncbi:hypothetical protein HLB23_05130 [Nocardia uniformis]|uniref:DUF6777 domain-containing protein n=1 Tax=Nocardia uniformis TaxID=53432 RepID=A0A849BVX0_9NOCA|nr:DUF6777 domain-containing protein [Nocardia uniformis]NNH69258.1 hypothetical protein [Nocardia uniformis]